MDRVAVAVLIPCLNEQASIYNVASNVRASLPEALVVVGDNGSTDQTASEARRAGALVITEHRRGKGLMMRRLFSEVDAECYLMLDGDGTYDTTDCRKLIDAVLIDKNDMSIGVRKEISNGSGDAYRSGHRFGNYILSLMFSRLMGLNVQDALSGFRAMSRRFVRTFAVSSIGFEIETDLNAHAALLGCRVCEIETPYRERPNGSSSKLRTYRDGLRILWRNFQLFQQVRPLLAFSALAMPWIISSLALFISFQLSYLAGDNIKVSSLVASSAFGLVGLHLITAGIVIKRISSQRAEQLILTFLGFP